MEFSSNNGVWDALRVLDVQSRNRTAQAQQPPPVQLLRRKLKQLTEKRDQLKAEIQTHKKLQKIRTRLDSRCDDEGMEEVSENSPVLELIASQTRLKDLLYAHHIVGGYDIMKTEEGRGVRVSLATAYEGTYMDTYYLEMRLQPTLRIQRHNIPPFIPLNSIAEQNMETDMQLFLSILNQHLNAFAGRKQQLKLVKELHKSVEVLESNLLCSILVLVLPLVGDENGMLCTLDYSDHTKSLPTRVTFDCEDKELPGSPQWKRNCNLLMETPVHKALTKMKTMRDISE
ncbi:centromere protein O [Synchiropus splendidus]|uniref:centromere protein O n=1 Tax=Synchiropus splendidus TaxID=270530 RepID=UPI00237ED706|nr:centromere protein O [Synchiropus splendidus]